MLLWQRKLEKCINCYGTTESEVGSMNGQGREDKSVTWNFGHQVQINSIMVLLI